jgi:phosphatidylglycerophosphatase A
VHRLVASWFGTGLILARLTGAHDGSGTVGAAFAMPIWWLLVPVGWWAQALAALAVTLLAVWASRPFSEHHADPGWVVVDEAAGALVATVGLVGLPAFLAWVVFRIADIRKHLFPGVAAADSLPGPWGITLDDLVAAVYGLAAGWGLELLIRL